MTLAGFFAGRPASRGLYRRLRRCLAAIGPTTQRVTKSQIAVLRARPFAWVWIPGRYLRGDTAPLVLTVLFTRRDRSSRWKEVVEPRSGSFVHHLELRRPEEIDGQVARWLARAWRASGGTTARRSPEHARQGVAFASSGSRRITE